VVKLTRLIALLVIPALALFFAGVHGDNYADVAAGEEPELSSSIETRVVADANAALLTERPVQEQSVITFTETFDSYWPSPWVVFDNNGSAYGSYCWAPNECRAYSDGYSGWPARDCANGYPSHSYACTVPNRYPNNMDSWMVYGPISLSRTLSGGVSYRAWIDTELNFDKCGVSASINGTNFYGVARSGDNGGYVNYAEYFSSWPGLGNLLGQPQVWVAFIATSDGSVVDTGCFLDDIVVRRDDGDYLTMAVSPPGGGTTSPPVGTYLYPQGATVAVSASPNAGYQFSQWSGACSGTNPNTSVLMNADKTCTANFISPQYTLTMQVSPAGSGTTTPPVGSHPYNSGTTVNVSASPNAGYQFSQWTGDCSGTNPATSVYMNGNKTCTANFEAEGRATVRIGSGQAPNCSTDSVPLEILDPPVAVGAATIDIVYDPAVAEPTGWSAGPGWDMVQCSLNYAPNKVRCTAIDATGMGGDSLVADLTFHCIGETGQCTSLDVTVVTLTDPNGSPIPSVDQDGQFCCGGLCGDVNCDGAVDSVDAMFILQYVVGLRSPSDQCPPPTGYLHLPSCVRVDCDADCDAVDALFILQLVVGIRPGVCACP